MNCNPRFLNKVVIVTGAAQGIGRGVAIQAAAEGAQVVMADLSPYVEEVLAEIEAKGGDAIIVKANLETYVGAEAVMAKALETYGRIDVLINNVGGAIWMKPFEVFSEEEIIKEVNRSLFPTMWCCRAVLPQMIKQQHGTIVNVSSIATRGINRVPYWASKDGIRVNAVATGGTEAPPRKVPRNANPLTETEKVWMQQVVDQTIDRTFLGRYGTIQEQVNAILFLASDESSYMTGTVVPVGGGDLG